MSSGKQNNSILMVAALGVYLGLLMAGAAPGVLAQQAAMTRQFDLKDEIEFSENLDKDPRETPADEHADRSDDLTSPVRTKLIPLSRIASFPALISGPETEQGVSDPEVFKPVVHTPQSPKDTPQIWLGEISSRMLFASRPRSSIA